MKRKRNFLFKTVILLFTVTVFNFQLYANEKNFQVSFDEIEKSIQKLMRKGDIPGLSLVIINGAHQISVKGYGYADIETQEPATPDTLFEIGSCSKSFTALALLQLEQEGLVHLDDPVITYLPWFFATYQGKNSDITLKHVLHHTSGIPRHSIARIPESSQKNALDQTVRNLVGIELNAVPGTRFEYATINYDILGLILETVSGMSYEEYMADRVFAPLGLKNTTVGIPKENLSMATGYKIGFFAPRKYEAPVYRGNYPAGYIISNGKDIAKWLQLQMGLLATEFAPIIEQTHLPNRTISPNAQDFSSYAMGWQVYQKGSGEIAHGGVNPNFTAYIGFRPEDKIGVAVLANSNSNATLLIGEYILSMLSGESPAHLDLPGNNVDKACSVLSGIFGVYLSGILTFFGFVVLDIVKGRRHFERLTFPKTIRFLLAVLICIPFLVGVYLLPYAMTNVPWNTAIVWSPISLPVAVGLFVAAIGVSYITYGFSLLFPQKNKYKRQLPVLVALSLLSGVANAVVIFLVANSLQSSMRLGYIVYYFGLATFLYIGGRKIIETNLIKIAMEIIYDLRMQLVDKIFATSYQNFEKLDRGRVYATLNDDTAQIGESAGFVVIIITSMITVCCAFFYLAVVSFWVTMLTLLVITLIAMIYYVVGQQAQMFFERARDTRNVYMRLINGLLDGYKELYLHSKKKHEYKHDVEHTTNEFRQTQSLARIKFINAFLIGESMLVVVMGVISFGFSTLFPQITTATLMTFIVVLLYLIGPINGILQSIPRIVEMRVSWNRVQQFFKEIPAPLSTTEQAVVPAYETSRIDRMNVEGMAFAYENSNGQNQFAVGPIDFEINTGEIFFIIGGNGSGKTTLAKLLTGLYTPERGKVTINGSLVEHAHLGEYFSTVFSDFFLFEKLYSVNLEGRHGDIQHYLSLLELEEKVHLQENKFSTIDLSGGQRKRLALFQCYLEDRPIYLFDEWAADQDPVFRKFFYRELLPKMKQDGKIVIAITHDDHYFDVADKILKMDMGKVDFLEHGDVAARVTL